MASPTKVLPSPYIISPPKVLLSSYIPAASAHHIFASLFAQVPAGAAHTYSHS